MPQILVDSNFDPLYLEPVLESTHSSAKRRRQSTSKLLLVGVLLAGLLVGAGMAATIPMQIVYAGERFAAVGAGTAVAIINTGGQLSQSLDGPFYGTLLDLGLGFQTIWLVATVLGVVRIGAVLLLREDRTS